MGFERFGDLRMQLLPAIAQQRPPPDAEPAGIMPIRKYALRTMRSTQS
jgi:hypothetical protein